MTSATKNGLLIGGAALIVGYLFLGSRSASAAPATPALTVTGGGSGGGGGGGLGSTISSLETEILGGGGGGGAGTSASANLSPLLSSLLNGVGSALSAAGSALGSAWSYVTGSNAVSPGQTQSVLNEAFPADVVNITGGEAPAPAFPIDNFNQEFDPALPGGVYDPIGLSDTAGPINSTGEIYPFYNVDPLGGFSNDPADNVTLPEPANPDFAGATLDATDPYINANPGIGDYNPPIDPFNDNSAFNDTPTPDFANAED